MKRLVLASLIAPLATPLLYWMARLGVALADPLRRTAVANDPFSGLGIIFAVGSPVAYAATFAVGLPALWLLHRFGPLTLARSIFVGALVGLGVAVVVGPSFQGEIVSAPLPGWLGAILGGMTAAAWWRLAFGRDVHA